MIKLADMPTDRYSRYTDLNKALVFATGVADRSEDNKEALIECLKVAVEYCGYEVVKPRKTVKKATKSTSSK